MSAVAITVIVDLDIFILNFAILNVSFPITVTGIVLVIVSVIVVLTAYDSSIKHVFLSVSVTVSVIRTN